MQAIGRANAEIEGEAVSGRGQEEKEKGQEMRGREGVRERGIAIGPIPRHPPKWPNMKIRPYL